MGREEVNNKSDWNKLVNRPNTFPSDWDEVANKPESFGGSEIGDILKTYRTPDETFLACDGSVYLQSAYPDLFNSIGLIGNPEYPMVEGSLSPGSPYLNLWNLCTNGEVYILSFSNGSHSSSVTNYQKRFFRSNNLTTWTQIFGGNTTGFVYFDGSNFVRLKHSGGVEKSTDGLTWSQSLSATVSQVYKIARNGFNAVVLLGADNSYGLRRFNSTHNILYNQFNSGVSYKDIKFINNQFVALNNSGYNLGDSNGENFGTTTPFDNITDHALITYFGNKYIVFSNTTNGKYYYATDITDTFTIVNSNLPYTNPTDLIYDNEKLYVVFGNQGGVNTIYYTLNPFEAEPVWIEVSNTASIRQLEINENLYLGAGNSGILRYTPLINEIGDYDGNTSFQVPDLTSNEYIKSGN